LLGTLFRLLKGLNEAMDRALQEELERAFKELEEIERMEREGNVRVEEYHTPWGIVRVETFEITIPPFTPGGLEGRIVELDENDKEEKEDVEPPEEGLIEVGGIPMKVERRGRDWREENR